MGCVRGCLECCSTSCSALSRCAQQRAITISFARLGTGFGRRADEWKSVWGREYHTAPQTQQTRVPHETKGKHTGWEGIPAH